MAPTVPIMFRVCPGDATSEGPDPNNGISLGVKETRLRRVRRLSVVSRTPITSYWRRENRRDALRASPRFAVLVTPMREMVA